MDATYVHLTITHLPVFGLFLGFLALAYGLIRRETQVKLVALAIIIIATVGAIIAFSTGESAEERVEHLSGITHDAIEKHEESAELTIIFFYGLGMLSLITLFLESRSKKYANTLSLIVLCFTVLAFYFVAQTAVLGGKIRHTEIGGETISQQHNATPAQDTHEHSLKEVGFLTLNNGAQWIADAHTRSVTLPPLLSRFPATVAFFRMSISPPVTTKSPWTIPSNRIVPPAQRMSSATTPFTAIFPPATRTSCATESLTVIVPPATIRSPRIGALIVTVPPAT